MSGIERCASGCLSSLKTGDAGECGVCFVDVGRGDEDRFSHVVSGSEILELGGGGAEQDADLGRVITPSLTTGDGAGLDRQRMGGDGDELVPLTGTENTL